MKATLETKLKEESSNSDPEKPSKTKESEPEKKQMVVELKNIVSEMNQYNLLFQELKLQTERQNELKKHLNSKVQEIVNSEAKINNLYNDIKRTYSNGIEEISKKVSDLEKNNNEIKQRVFQMAKDAEKEKILQSTLSSSSSNIYMESLKKDCYDRGSCNICLEDPKCVWCSVEKKCLPGDFSGPLDGSCSLSFEYGSCSQQSCSTFKTCGSCLENLTCGWCEASKLCLDGNKIKPSKQVCLKDYIHKQNYKKCKVN